MTKTIWPEKPRIYTIWPLIEKVCQPRIGTMLMLLFRSIQFPLIDAVGEHHVHMAKLFLWNKEIEGKHQSRLLDI